MVSIILPFVRVEGAARCMDAISRNSGDVVYEVLAEEDKHHIGCNPMVNRLVDKSKFDIVCFVHDDSIPQKNFLENAYRSMRAFPGGYGCVGFNDMVHDIDAPCTHWMIHKKMLKYFPDGVFYSEDYIHTRVDLELKEVCKSVGRYKWDKYARIKHMTPFYYKIDLDASYKRCYSAESIRKDRATFIKRREAQNAKWADPKIARVRKRRDVK